ncbi:hypothetical protein ASD65_07235 [Microbacterium sp. Root61]|uniref:DUF305 domain-containing protein n=1 Tax=Microbacterium sp. Root61 TaxID=1736570 RepID=UPI0006F50B20|nr:DUF305 domain-containing protein [Microbacterium sp. Root61]KRA24237.1 hypothetical protein ASD65_07235 [Microbacterium sp. Root61]
MRNAVAAVGLVVALSTAAVAIAFAAMAGRPGGEAPTVMASPSGTGPAEPISASDFCFVESMIFYRVEARELGVVLLDTPEVSPDAEEVATESIAEQDAALDALREQYVAWSAAKPLERSDDGPCAGHGAHADMPGLPTAAQRTELASATGADAERLYIALLQGQTAGVIDLATETLAGGPHGVVRATAEEAVAQGEGMLGTLEELVQQQ